MKAKSYYRHRKCLDIDLYTLNVYDHGDKWLVSCFYVAQRDRALIFNYGSPDLVTIDKSAQDNWLRLSK